MESLQNTYVQSNIIQLKIEIVHLFSIVLCHLKGISKPLMHAFDFDIVHTRVEVVRIPGLQSCLKEVYIFQNTHTHYYIMVKHVKSN